MSFELAPPGLLLHDHILGQRFKPLAIGLDDRDRDRAGLTGMDVPDDTGFAFMRSRHHFAFYSVSKTGDFKIDFRFGLFSHGAPINSPVCHHMRLNNYPRQFQLLCPKATSSLFPTPKN